MGYEGSRRKVAVITGGSSGIGLATAKLFQQAGARVAISGRNQKSLDDAAKELGPKAIAVRSGVSKRGTWIFFSTQ
jgi:NADP-dependent 3-hydroxy acid dehydrogenase YdfG